MRDNDYLSRPGANNPPRILTLFSIASVQNDYLVCNPMNGDDTVNTTPGTSRYILKPWTLSQTPFDGKTVNGVAYTYTSHSQRTAVSGSTTETQLITQDYFAGALIYAELIQPKVKLVGGPGDGHYTGLLDANNDARAWAVQ
jgi:hypothetical protein